MAELPDLTVFANILNKKFKGKKLKKLEVKVAKKLKVTTEELQEALEHQTLQKVERSGKTLQFHFGKNTILGLHLMLQGELKEISSADPLPKHCILAFHFKNSKGFAVTDILKQATPALNPAENKVPDALEIAEKEFLTLLSKRKKTIKELLMDQKAIRGIGNSYGDEILWAAKISPLSIANKIPESNAKYLYECISKTLKQAISDIEKANSDELTGELRDFMKVHGAKIKTSPTGIPVKQTTIGGRTAYFTQEQHLYT
ncbi:DNA-formamidopyrimidine glycosylase family protein [Pedobacter aquatilis]|uniref:DNA-formamidopyrimidine glycosylase family protein n=1 Tax=Pedobacter aquatilis TaxID=351343 RepID=UPI00292D7D55|nr:DNA-formamidopyrimidine glycosylase family protein [Pedobacter aquatilis]